MGPSLRGIGSFSLWAPLFIHFRPQRRCYLCTSSPRVCKIKARVGHVVEQTARAWDSSSFRVLVWECFAANDVAIE